ncbi:divalent cation tolerance protein CutA [Coxiella endosymbiont of Dermacentor marginatus]|uniref:divalent cation tolerance protein CutA n=1 Tax=Coxiella endosymbiont of Dermacentor marginatus TaxID=1656159 RepID=UPI0022230322|nr:divalent cation tolerance protein CutA [Coxiella endosymbiont of Dermacentor marginatus]
MYKIAFYVPKKHLDSVKTALFAKGAGRIGDYDYCSWQTSGTGQYRPLNGSKPYIGTQGQIETVKEYLVEIMCENEHLQAVLEELIHVHPYETPAYAAWKVESLFEKVKKR